MMRRRLVIGLAILAPLVLASCGASRTVTYRYRMMVEVQTPGGLRSGSSVIEVSVSEGIAFPGPEAGGIGGSVTGEAVAVDLPDGRTLFALLSGPSRAGAGGYAVTALLPKWPDRRGTGEAYLHNLEIMKTRKHQAELQPANYPPFVRFGDTRDPKSIALLEPKDFAASFGSGTRLRRITIQLTDDPVTTGIEKRLPWLNRLDSYRTDPSNPFTTTLPRLVSGIRSPMRSAGRR